MLAGEKGFEPLTFGFGNHYSTIETILLFLSSSTYKTLETYIVILPIYYDIQYLLDALYSH